MFRAFEIALIVMVVCATAYTFYIKNQSEMRLAEIERLEAEIKDHRQTIDLLEADWSLLNQPRRVQKLIELFEEQLQLKTAEAEQIVSPEELPRVKPEPVPEMDIIAGTIKTGSVE